MSDKRYRHLDCPQCINTYRQNRRRELGLDKCRATHKWYVIKSRYGISMDEYNELLQSQEFKCAICSEDISEQKQAHLDHCHTSGAVRGFLCGQWNKALGLFKDSTDSLRKAIAYLESGEVKVGPDMKNLEKVKVKWIAKC